MESSGMLSNATIAPKVFANALMWAHGLVTSAVPISNELPAIPRNLWEYSSPHLSSPSRNPSRTTMAICDQEGSLNVTYIGHASILMRGSSESLIADPMFSSRVATVFSRRRTPLAFDPLTVNDLGAVLLSHGHHDHMDLRSLSMLGKEVPIVLPKGVSIPLRTRGFKDIRPTRPWDHLEIGTFGIQVVPSHHFGGRPPFYITAGYQGYVISREKCVYFAGDTGFDAKMFKDIGLRCSIDLAVLPIGAYHPPSFRKHHMSPEDALEAFRLLGAKRMMPIHFETLSLSMEPLEEPRRRLLAEAEKLGCVGSLDILRSGETVEVCSSSGPRS